MKKKPTYRIVSEIFEEGSDYPAVTHIFLGDTPQRVRAFLRAHLKNDAFFRACSEKGRFASFSCHEKRRLEHFTGQGWLVVGSE